MTSSPDIDACKRAGETARDTADALLEEVETLKQQIVVKQREYERALSVAQDAEEADEQFREAFEEKQEQDREVAELKEQLQAAEDRRNQTSTRLKVSTQSMTTCRTKDATGNRKPSLFWLFA